MVACSCSLDKMMKAVVFDMDGTLGDTLPLCVESFARCVEECTGRRPSEEEVTAHFSVSDRGILAGLMGMSPDAPELPVARFAEIYDELHPQYAPAPFPGAVELLRRLKADGWRLALLTGKEACTALPTLRHFGMQDVFEAKLYGQPTHNCKAERLAELMQLWQLSPDELIYIGDAPSDIEQSHRAGVRIICAAWSPHVETEEAEDCLPDFRLTDFSQLEPLLAELRA